MKSDELWMQRALQLAARGQGGVEPNPMVGCVLVRKDQVVAEGWHQEFGQAHAEIIALDKVRDPLVLSESELYVTLEPCSHFGRTPPCVDRIIRDNVKRVIYGCKDPNSLVSGQGIHKLLSAGVNITGPVLKHECIALNRRFFTFHKLKRPYVLLKWAQTSDGFIAREDFTSQWISCQESRNLVHRWRSEEQAILVGTRTAQIDNPQLTVRMLVGRNPIRVVADRRLMLSKELHLLNDGLPTLVFNEISEERIGAVQYCKICSGRPLVEEILARLHAENILSVMVEGGARTLQSFIDANLWDEARVFRSPHAFGSGVQAPRLPVDPSAQEQIGADTLLRYSISEFAAGA